MTEKEFISSVLITITATIQNTFNHKCEETYEKLMKTPNEKSAIIMNS